MHVAVTARLARHCNQPNPSSTSKVAGHPKTGSVEDPCHKRFVLFYNSKLAPRLRNPPNLGLTCNLAGHPKAGRVAKPGHELFVIF